MVTTAIYSPDSDRSQFDALRAEFPDLELRYVDDPADLPAALDGAHALVSSNRYYTPDVGAFAQAHGGALRWVHFVTSGIDKAIASGLPPGCVVTNSAGLRAFAVAEHALALMLGLVRQLNQAEAGRLAREWRRDEINARMDNLAGKTALIVGMGAIGRDIGRKAKAFDMRVIGISRSATPPANFDAVRPREALVESAAACDMLIVAANHDESTHHIVSRAVIDALPRHALVINIARGKLIEETALVQALSERRIGGAGLDVAEEEPLPPDHAFWSLDNVMLTPHIGGGGAANPHANHASLFADNLRLMQKGLPLERVVIERT
jgi:phosphoglycerate dehydrogenase-like enzyme